jgi:hypothetical protein
MLARKTVFVIGAGASHEFGLPLGMDLLDAIHSTIRQATLNTLTDKFFLSIIKSSIPNINSDTQRKLARFAEGLPLLKSIDRYLDFHKDDMELVSIGKFAISYQILLAEQRSKLRIDQTNPQPLAAASNTYLRGLFSLMTEDTTPASISDMFNNISFICFNYDRCIEAYFHLAVKALLDCSAQKASEVCNNLKISHPYGTVGKLFNSFPPNDHLSNFLFGQDIATENLANRSWEGIRTFTENMDDEIKLNAIHTLISEAERIIFIGFSFLEQNMKLLTTPTRRISAKEILATNLGMSQSDTDIVTAYSRFNLISKHPDREGDFALFPKFYNQTAGDFISSESNYLRR